jgi:hypothetical protein
MNNLGTKYETLQKFRDYIIHNGSRKCSTIPRKLEKTISNARETQVQFQLSTNLLN